MSRALKHNRGLVEELGGIVSDAPALGRRRRLPYGSMEKKGDPRNRRLCACPKRTPEFDDSKGGPFLRCVSDRGTAGMIVKRVREEDRSSTEITRTVCRTCTILFLRRREASRSRRQQISASDHVKHLLNGARRRGGCANRHALHVMRRTMSAPPHWNHRPRETRGARLRTGLGERTQNRLAGRPSLPWLARLVPPVRPSAASTAMRNAQVAK